MLCLSTLFRPVSSGVAVGSGPSLGWWTEHAVWWYQPGRCLAGGGTVPFGLGCRVAVCLAVFPRCVLFPARTFGGNVFSCVAIQWTKFVYPAVTAMAGCGSSRLCPWFGFHDSLLIPLPGGPSGIHAFPPEGTVTCYRGFDVPCVCRGFAVKTAGAVISPVTRLSKGS